jgi:glycosyltransferase involved in cell wall biosynthesis
MEQIKISLITTLFNEACNIDRFLDSYKAQTKYADEFVIVDGGSSDGTIEKIEKFTSENKILNIKLIVDKTCSKKFVAGPIAKGRNVAIENASYKHIAATDAGCVLDSRWLEEIVKPFEDESVDVVSGWYETQITNEFQKIYASIAMPKLETVDRDNFLPSSRSIAFKKSCWKQVGGYPTMTYTAEDTKYDLDLKNMGCQFVFNEKAFVYWECPLDFLEMVRKQIAYGYGDGQLLINKSAILKQLVIVCFPVLLYIRNRRNSIASILILHSILFSNLFGYIKGVIKK